ncbi:D-2-hydroxyacid dehydrogenase [Paenibacillus chitinolyticus]|uniref:D-2-hydroxyacid dehydrogenase n=1 Tax=Paenibacillus chitinolyticus TaxID=79263 RepID=UPI0036711DF5
MLNITALTKMDLTYLQNHLPEDLKDAVSLAQFPTAEEAGDRLASTDILLTSGAFQDDWLLLLPKLRWFQSLSAGVDKLPLKKLDERGIQVTNMSGVHSIQMSEYALSVMLDFVRRSHTLKKSQSRKEWNHRIRTTELHGQTLGLIGTGAIGSEVARKAKAFDMKVIGYSRSGRDREHFDDMRKGKSGLHSLLRESDFVVVIVPATRETENLIGAEELALMKPSAFLVNMARGSVINETALIEALRKGNLTGAALDVFREEPLPADSPLWEMEQAALTPHIAGNTPKYVERCAEILFPNIRRFIENKPLINRIDPEHGY